MFHQRKAYLSFINLYYEFEVQLPRFKQLVLSVQCFVWFLTPLFSFCWLFFCFCFLPKFASIVWCLSNCRDKNKNERIVHKRTNREMNTREEHRHCFRQRRKQKRNANRKKCKENCVYFCKFH